MQIKRGTRISTDRFPNLQGDPRACTFEKFFGFYLPEVSFPGFLSHSDGILARFQLEKFFLFKVYLFMKNMTDFRKTVETGVDSRLQIM